MATQEFYIREASDNEARGPFNLEQLMSLAETGQVTPETLWYDPTVEDWASIASNDALKLRLFPEKRKLRMKVRDIAPVSKNSDSLPPITVEDMLAGAEGRTEETKDKRDPIIMQSRAAAIGMWSIVLIMVLAAAGELLPSAEAIAAVDVNKVMAQPLVFLGIIDLLIATMIGLGVVAFYPVVRFRAAAGLGMYGFIFLVQGQATPMLALAVGSAGLYFATVWIDLLPVFIVSAMGILGIGGTSYFLLSV